MAYLKALGIFRLVSEQKDPSARAWWRNDRLVMRSSLDREGLASFFLDEYKPTPIVSPWNGGSGFYARDNQDAINAISATAGSRFRHYREVISMVRRNKTMDPLIRQFADAEEVKGNRERKQARKEADAARSAAKDKLLAECRVTLPDDSLDWLDAAYVLTTGGAKYPPLLGTGGNDGRLEFSNNFMQNTVLALDLDELRDGKAITRSQVTAALFNEDSPRLVRKRSTGFYNPGSVGGTNASVGFDDEALTNPWDYILMIEGALLFAGATARRLSAQTNSNAVYPFTVDNSAAGYGTSVGAEYGDASRAEFWAPLWDWAANLHELKHLVSEGRAQLGRRQVSSGTDFARAVVGLGTERGISQFQRYGLLERNGKAYLATPLGRFHVTPIEDAVEDTAQLANVLFDLDTWMRSIRRNVTGRSAPAGLAPLLNRLEGVIFEFCQQGRKEDMQSVLIAVGHAERWLSKSGLRKDNDKGKGVRPLNGLSPDWVRYADDGSPEFRLARALASILGTRPGEGKQIGPVRENLAPVSTDGRTSWKEDSASFVWTAGDPLDNMLAVLERRCLEGRMQGLTCPPLSSGFSARLADVVGFLDGGTDIQRVADLALPLSFVRYWRRDPEKHAGEDAVQRYPAPSELPVAYAAMKLTLLAEAFDCPEFGPRTAIWMEPRMLAMLRAGRVGEAYAVAHRRLKASGLQPLSDEPGLADGSGRGRRLAAALLFPLDGSNHCALAERAVRKPNRTES